MINCLCVIQEGQAPDQRRDQLGAALGRFTEEHLGAGAEISWLPVAAGNGFTSLRGSPQRRPSFHSRHLRHSSSRSGRRYCDSS